MSYVRGVITGLVAALILAGAAGAAAWLWFSKPAAAAKASPPPPPAAVTKTLKEDQLATVTLTPEAVGRLALQTAPVERRTLPRVRVYGGEVIVPPGHTVVVAAPVSGQVQAAPGGLPSAGQRVRKGQVVYQLAPLVTPEGRATLAGARIDAEGQVKTAQTQLEAARVALERAQRLLKSEAGSRRAVDEAQALYDLADKAVEAATSRRDTLVRLTGEVGRGLAPPLPVEAPEDGRLRNVSALPGQNVPAGGTLFEVMDLGRVWVRVPVYVGDLPEIDPVAPAGVGDLAARPGPSPYPAEPVQAPPAAAPAAGTVDLFYALDNKDDVLSPGQRVGVTVRLRSAGEGLAVPWSAVVHDMFGGTWVYEQTGERVYTRRRVLVRHVVGDTAELAAGPAPGTRVVATGAAELFGTETGFTK